jgi:hypothetical protein
MTSEVQYLQAFCTGATYDPVSKSIIAKRIQYPLKLGYSITIHKSQGMSLDSVIKKKNCKHNSK